MLIGATAWFWGAEEVRGDVGMVVFLMLAGVVWMIFSSIAFSWLGVSIRDDAWERRNSAASVALGGALLAVATMVAAGNLGEGPSLWENVFSAGLAMGVMFSLWVVFELGGHVSVSIAEERDLASGLRFGGLLMAWGLILGRAVTGNWHSAGETIRDFLCDGWPAVLLWMVALAVESLLKPSRMRPFPRWFNCGVVPATLYLAVAAVWLWHLGRWEGMPR